MANLSYIEKDAINKVFNQGGYVLNFSTSNFNRFTLDSIGIPLCEKYNLSKGKSLNAFIEEGDDYLVAKLIEDLIVYYESGYFENQVYNDGKIDVLKKCVIKLRTCNYSKSIKSITDELTRKFNSDYISAQIEQMNDSIEKHPSDSIGKAKELLESCCKTILSKKEIVINKDLSVHKLVKKTCEELKLTPEDIPNSAKASETIKSILGSLTAIASGMAELRNSYGSGHGKSADYKGLSPRHARLVVSSATSIVLFLWDTYEEQNCEVSQK